MQSEPTGKESTTSRVQQAFERAGGGEVYPEAGKVCRVVHQEGVEVAAADHLHSQRPLLLLQLEQRPCRPAPGTDREAPFGVAGPVLAAPHVLSCLSYARRLAAITGGSEYKKTESRKITTSKLRRCLLQTVLREWFLFLPS